MSASVFALRQIFSDPVVSLRRRLDAAEAVLMFESPEVVAADAKAFLTEIFEDPDCHVNWRVAALKIMRRAESRRVTQLPVSPGEAHRNREAWRRKAIEERKQELIAADLWPAPSDWCDDLRSQSWIPPEGNPHPPIDATGFGDKMYEMRMKKKNGGQSR